MTKNWCNQNNCPILDLGSDCFSSWSLHTIYPITVAKFALLNCKSVEQESDSMMVPDIKLFIFVGCDRFFLSIPWSIRAQLMIFFCSGDV